MWYQILYVILPGVALAFPFLSNEALKARGRRKQNSLAASTHAESHAEIASIASGGASKAEVEAPIERQPLEGSKSFQYGLKLLEKRGLENSAYDIYGYLFSLLKELQSLNGKLALSDSDQRIRLAYAKYNPLISKINELTAPNYYGDFLRNPDHWDEAQKKRKQVELAVLALAKETSKDIRRLNSSQELNFKVSVESIIGKAASDAESKNSDSAVTDLLSEQFGMASELNGDLEGLTSAVALESSELARKQLEAQQDEDRRIEDELAAKKFKAGSKSSIDLNAEEQRTLRPVMLSRQLFKKTFSIYGPGGGEKNFLVSQINSVTGESHWQEFSSIYKAASWVDTAVVAEEEKHDFKCGCVYCRED